MIRQSRLRYWILFCPKAKNWACRGRAERTERTVRTRTGRTGKTGRAGAYSASDRNNLVKNALMGFIVTLHLSHSPRSFPSFPTFPSFPSFPSSPHRPNHIALGYPGQRRHVADRPSKHGVRTVEVRMGAQGDEPLARAGVRAGEGHSEHRLDVVPDPIDLVPDGSARAAEPVASRIAVLHHEVRHHPVPSVAVEEATVHQTQEVRYRERCV